MKTKGRRFVSRKVCITSCCIMTEAVGNDCVDNQRVMTCVKNRS